MLVVAKELAPGSFGIYSLAIIAAGLLGYINSLGVFDGFLVQLNPAHGSSKERRFARDSGVLFSVGVSVVTSGLAAALYVAIGGDAQETSLFPVAVVFLVAQNLFNVLMIEVQAEGRSNKYALLLTSKSLVPIMVIVAFHPGDRLVFFLFLDAICLLGLCLYCFATTSFPMLRNFSWARVSSLMRQGRAFTGQNAVQNLGMNADKWAVGIGLGAAQFGVYSLAAQLIACGLAFASMVQVYFLPKLMSASIGGESPRELMLRVRRVSIYSLGVSSILFFCCLVVAKPIISIFYSDYGDAISVLPIFALSGVVISSNHADLYFRARQMGATYLAIQIFTLLALLMILLALVLAGGILWMYAAVFASVRIGQAFASYIAIRRDANQSEPSLVS